MLMHAWCSDKVGSSQGPEHPWTGYKFKGDPPVHVCVCVCILKGPSASFN